MEICTGHHVRMASPYIGAAYLRRIISVSASWQLLTDMDEWMASLDWQERQKVIAFIQAYPEHIHHCQGLHAKVVISDSGAYMGSANLTKMGIALRTEMGIHLQDPGHVQELAQWFDTLWLQTSKIEEGQIQQAMQAISHSAAYGEASEQGAQSPSHKNRKEALKTQGRLTPVILQPVQGLSSRIERQPRTLPEGMQGGGPHLNAQSVDLTEVMQADAKEAKVSQPPTTMRQDWVILNLDQCIAQFIDTSAIHGFTSHDLLRSLKDEGRIPEGLSRRQVEVNIQKKLLNHCATHFRSVFNLQATNRLVLENEQFIQSSHALIQNHLRLIDDFWAFVISRMRFDDPQEMPWMQIAPALMGPKLNQRQQKYLHKALADCGFLVAEKDARLRTLYTLNEDWEWSIRHQLYQKAHGLWLNKLDTYTSQLRTQRSSVPVSAATVSAPATVIAQKNAPQISEGLTSPTPTTTTTPALAPVPESTEIQATAVSAPSTSAQLPDSVYAKSPVAASTEYTQGDLLGRYFLEVLRNVHWLEHTQLNLQSIMELMLKKFPALHGQRSSAMVLRLENSSDKELLSHVRVRIKNVPRFTMDHAFGNTSRIEITGVVNAKKLKLGFFPQSRSFLDQWESEDQEASITGGIHETLRNATSNLVNIEIGHQVKSSENNATQKAQNFNFEKLDLFLHALITYMLKHENLVTTGQMLQAQLYIADKTGLDPDSCNSFYNMVSHKEAIQYGMPMQLQPVLYRDRNSISLRLASRGLKYAQKLPRCHQIWSRTWTAMESLRRAHAKTNEGSAQKNRHEQVEQTYLSVLNLMPLQQIHLALKNGSHKMMAQYVTIRDGVPNIRLKHKRSNLGKRLSPREIEVMDRGLDLSVAMAFVEHSGFLHVAIRPDRLQAYERVVRRMGNINFAAVKLLAEPPQEVKRPQPMNPVLTERPQSIDATGEASGRRTITKDDLPPPNSKPREETTVNRQQVRKEKFLLKLNQIKERKALERAEMAPNENATAATAAIQSHEEN